MRVPERWYPPGSFPMQIWYGNRRRPVQLWTFPARVDKQGRVVLYEAVGPAGVPVMHPLITYIQHRPLPDHCRIKVIVDFAADGQVVFGVPGHTAN
jgi:hypothetical protein